MSEKHQTWISYRYNGSNTKLFIGETSKYEIETEQRSFEGMTTAAKIEDILKVKITFYELTENLIAFLKASENSQQGVMFWDEENTARGIYQTHYFQDELKQLAILELYQMNTQPIGAAWPGEGLLLGEVKQFIFGKGNFKINSYEFPISKSMIEKSSDKEIEKFKFSGSYRYFFTDKVNFKITVNDLQSFINQESDTLMINLAQLKNSMINLIPHKDKPEIIYNNLYLDYIVTNENRNRKVEISLNLMPVINNETVTAPAAPLIQVQDGKIIMSADEGDRIYYTTAVRQPPPTPTSSSLEYINPLNWYYGYYKAIAVKGALISPVTEKTISPSSVEMPTIIKIGNKIEIAGYPEADIYYTYNATSMPPNPTNISTKYTQQIDYKAGYYKAICKLVETYSPVTEKAFISSTDDAIHNFPLSADYEDQGSQPCSLSHYNTSFSDGGVLIAAEGMMRLSTSFKETNLTVSMWVKRITLTPKASLLSNDYATSRHLSIADSTNQNLICAYNGGFYKTNYDLPLGIWVFLAITIEPTNQNRQQFFVNGVIKSTLSVPWNMATQSIQCIGGNPEDNSFAFRGVIKKVRMYNRVLSAAEILEIFNLV